MVLISTIKVKTTPELRSVCTAAVAASISRPQADLEHRHGDRFKIMALSIHSFHVLCKQIATGFGVTSTMRVTIVSPFPRLAPPRSVWPLRVRPQVSAKTYALACAAY